MKTIHIKVYDATEDLFLELQHKNLIKLFIPSKKTFNLPLNKNMVDTIYFTNEIYGSHKLICVGINSTTIKLNYHPDNEDFILLNNTKYEFKPLFLIIGLIKQEKLQEKIHNNTISNDDIIAIRLKFNHPLLSFFTMLKDTVHCEVTTAETNKMNPIFFVTEPTNLKQIFLTMNDYTAKLIY
ncbi:MAG TPA: hypothetical protein PLD27_12020 [bacterium]|nr:hypothetical protein [bacterium]HOL48461.1 hypothetical protein [bacterium]HPQ19961.1 hypothetical protein [bacterium]